jgi:hypothetical protein
MAFAVTIHGNTRRSLGIPRRIHLLANGANSHRELSHDQLYSHWYLVIVVTCVPVGHKTLFPTHPFHSSLASPVSCLDKTKGLQVLRLSTVVGTQVIKSRTNPLYSCARQPHNSRHLLGRYRAVVSEGRTNATNEH